MAKATLYGHTTAVMTHGKRTSVDFLYKLFVPPSVTPNANARQTERSGRKTRVPGCAIKLDARSPQLSHHHGHCQVRSDES